MKIPKLFQPRGGDLDATLNINIQTRWKYLAEWWCKMFEVNGSPQTSLGLKLVYACSAGPSLTLMERGCGVSPRNTAGISPVKSRRCKRKSTAAETSGSGMGAFYKPTHSEVWKHWIKWIKINPLDLFTL